MKKEKLRIHHLEKSNTFGKVLDDISFSLYEGESIGLLALNDNAILALLEIIVGRVLPDAGFIDMDEGQTSPAEHRAGNRIAYIRRHSCLIDKLSITENIFVIRQHKHRSFYVNTSLFEQQVTMQFAELGINIDVNRPVSDLNEGEKCIIEIAKAYMLGATLIFIDTSATHFSDSDSTLQQIIASLKRRNITFLIADTRWTSLERYCDRIALFRNASLWKIVNADPNGKAIMEKILYKSAEEPLPRTSTAFDESQVVLTADHITASNRKALSFKLHAGEIICVSSYSKETLLEYVEQLKLPECLALLSRPLQGIDRNRIVVTDFNPGKHCIDSMSIQDNLCLPIYPRISSAGIIRKERINYVLKEFFKGSCMGSGIDARTRCSSLSEIEKLNLYLFRIKLQNPKYLLYVDVETTMNYSMRTLIHNTLAELAEQGTAIIILTTFIEDYERFSNRVTVIST